MKTTNTIKGIEVIAYKCMYSDMRCSDINCGDFQYEIGKTYKTDKAELYTYGFHAFINPLSAINNRMTTARYFKVLLSGEITESNWFDTELAATEITILEEITDTFDEVIKTEWWKNEIVLDLLYWSDGFARIERGDGLCNFIDKQGKLLLNEWYEWVDDFFEGFAIVQRRNDKLYNLIDTKGNILSSEWFEFVHCFEFGFADVERTNGECAKIDKNGKIVVSK